MDSATEHSDARHETTDAPAGPLGAVGIVLTLYVAASFLAIVILFKVLDYYQPFVYDDLEGSAPVHTLGGSRVRTSGPMLELDPPRQRLELNKIEDHILNEYEWVDIQEGRCRIPIDQAITTIAQKGFIPRSDGTSSP